MEFRRQAADAIWQSLEAHMGELADAMGIEQDVLRGGIAYAEPNKIIQTFDGTAAEVGFRIPKGWKQSWQMFFYLWVGEEEPEPCWFLAMIFFRQQPESAIDKLRVAARELGTKARGFDHDEKGVWISEAVSGEGPGLIAIVDSVLDRWIKLWKSVGGLTPLIPKADT